MRKTPSVTGLFQVLPPNLSLLVPSVLCHRNEELRVASIGGQKVNYEWSVPPPAVPAGSQRDNLMIWRNVRKLQKSLNHEPGNVAQIDTTGVCTMHSSLRHRV